MEGIFGGVQLSIYLDEERVSQEGNQKIRVLHVITRLNVGGPAVILNNLMSQIDKNKFELIIATGVCSPDEEDIRNFSDSYKPLKVSNDLKFMRNSINPIRDFLGIIELIFLFRKVKPDVVQTHTFKAGMIGRVASLFFKGDFLVVHTFHGHLLNGYFGLVRRKVVTTIEQILGKATDHFVVIGNKVAQDLISSGIIRKKKFSVFFPSVILRNNSTRFFVAQKKSENARFTVSFVGRLTQVKRPERILEIATLLENEPVDFIMVGGGELYNQLQTSIRSNSLNVRLLGWQSDIEDILMESDLVLLTSENEGIPVSLVEATALGKPILATKVGSVDEVVEDEFNGRLLNYSAREFANIVLEISQDAEKRTEYARNSLKLFNEKFSNSVMVDKYEKLYRNLTSNTE